MDIPMDIVLRCEREKQDKPLDITVDIIGDYKGDMHANLVR